MHFAYSEWNWAVTVACALNFRIRCQACAPGNDRQRRPDEQLVQICTYKFRIKCGRCQMDIRYSGSERHARDSLCAPVRPHGRIRHNRWPTNERTHSNGLSDAQWHHTPSAVGGREWRLINSSPIHSWTMLIQFGQKRLSVLNKHQSYIKTLIWMQWSCRSSAPKKSDSQSVNCHQFAPSSVRMDVGWCQHKDDDDVSWSCACVCCTRNIPTRKSNYSSNWLTESWHHVCASRSSTSQPRALGKYGRMKTHD